MNKIPVGQTIRFAYAFTFGDLKFASGDKLSQNEAWYTVHQIPD